MEPFVAKRKYRPFPPDLVQILQNIKDPWCRALACCQAGVIAETDATRALLCSCLGVDPHFDALIRPRLEIRALPLSRPRSPRRRKVWTPPNRLPSLFTSDASEIQNQPDVSPALIDEPLVAIAQEQLDWAGTAAAATLSADLLDLVVDPSGTVSIFADLIMGISDEEKAKLLEEWKPITKPSHFAPSGNLFRAFGIDLPEANGCDCRFPEIKARKRAKVRDVVTLPSLFITLQGEKEKP